MRTTQSNRLFEQVGVGAGEHDFGSAADFDSDPARRRRDSVLAAVRIAAAGSGFAVVLESGVGDPQSRPV